MGVKTLSDIDSIKYKFSRKAGRSIIDRQPIFSPDGESLLVIVENIVRVYNIQTGECSRTLETESFVRQLVAVQFPETETYNLYGCSDHGRLITWTWENGAVLRELNFQLPNNSSILTFDLLDDNACFVTLAYKPLMYGVFSIKTGQLLFPFGNSTIYYNPDMIKVAIGTSYGFKYAAICNGTKYLTIQNLNKAHIVNLIKHFNDVRILAVAAHKYESALAITDAMGRVYILRGNLTEDKNIGKEMLHWHFLPVMAVCFSIQGSYLYTGGIERVLVKWTLGNLATKVGEKQFIPRLPGLVRFVTTNNTHVAAALSNNSIVIANAQMHVVTTILECGGLSPLTRALVSPLVYHHRLGGLLMGGRAGHLQLYSTTTDKVLYNIDITEMNSIPPERHNLLPIETEVTCAAVCANGNWLVTSEYRNDGITYPEEKLKFWALQIKNPAPFKLNTCVNLSHSGCKVTSISLSVVGEFCVTAGDDQKFRIWKRENTSLNSKKKESWNCLTACYYSSGIAQYLSHDILNNYKNGEVPQANKNHECYSYLTKFVVHNDIVRKLYNIHKLNDFDGINFDAGMRKDEENDMGGVAVSLDGSLIAAWFGCKLTLWDTHLCNLRTTLSHPALRPKGIDVKFGNRDCSHYLVCTTENCIAVWSLLSLTIKWIVQIHPSCIAADAMSNKMAVVTTDNDLYLFTPHSSTPLMIRKNILNPKTGVVKQCAFASNSGSEVRLYFMRNNSEIYSLEPEKSNDGPLEVLSSRNLPTTNFSALLAEQQMSEVRPARTGEIYSMDTNALANNAIAQFLSAAPHMVPPVNLLSTSFLQHVLGQKYESPEENENDDVIEADKSSSEDEEEVESHTPVKAPQLWTPNFEKVKSKRLQKISDQLLDLHTTEAIFGI